MYNLLRSHSSYSLLRSTASPEALIKRVAKLGIGAAAITDNASVSGCVEFQKHAKKAGIKNINGIELSINDNPELKDLTNKESHHIVLLCKNLKGWKTLLKIISVSNQKEYYYDRARISLEMLSTIIDGNLIGVSGAIGTCLANAIFRDYNAAYKARTEESALNYVVNDLSIVDQLAMRHREIFGVDNFFIEIQNLNADVIPATKIIADVLRECSIRTGIPCAATANPYYTTKEYKRDQQVLLCASEKTTLKKINQLIVNNEDVNIGSFFNNDSIYHIPEETELRYNTEDELKQTNLIADMCESYDITNRPILPKFETPGKIPEIEYLKVLARKGWKSYFGDTKPDKVYGERINYELGVIEKANLAGYFLIVQDYVNYIREQNILVGSGRGSSGGCLTSLLLGITQGVDPIKYGLIFERFYNEGRNTAERTALPDIDVDFPSDKRYLVFEYLQTKYGKPNFAHLCTFTGLKGKSALKDVLRVTDACDPQTQNEITISVPDEAKIADELQTMKELGLEPSIIMWALQNKANELAKFCRLNDKGKLEGDYAKQFAQAMRLEGCKRTQSRHASAVVISGNPLSELVPMVYDKTSPDPICGFSMGPAEDVGLVKLDILAISVLSKIQDCIEDNND